MQIDYITDYLFELGLYFQAVLTPLAIAFDPENWGSHDHG